MSSTCCKYKGLIHMIHNSRTCFANKKNKPNLPNNLACVLQHNSGLYCLPLWYRRCLAFICSSGDARMRWQNGYYSPSNCFWMLSLLSAPLLRLKRIKRMKQQNKPRNEKQRGFFGSGVHVWSVNATSFICFIQTGRDFLDAASMPSKDHVLSLFCPIATNASLKVTRQFSLRACRSSLGPKSMTEIC